MNYWKIRQLTTAWLCCFLFNKNPPAHTILVRSTASSQWVQTHFPGKAYCTCLISSVEDPREPQPCAEISQTSCQPPRMMRVGYLVQHHQLERKRNHTLKLILFNSFCTSSYGHVRVKLNDVPACAVPLPAQCPCGQLGLSSGKGNREDEGSTTIHVWCCLAKNNNILT